jgi:hypothetical protein
MGVRQVRSQAELVGYERTVVLGWREVRLKFQDCYVFRR